MERALLVSIKLDYDNTSWPVEEIAYELEELASACSVTAVSNIYCHLKKPSANLLIGSGKAEEIALLAEEEDIDSVIFSSDLSGTQQRNLEEIIGKKTIDRTQLILDIFARRAKTPEGKTQVELAQLQYMMPRLVGKGIVLSRLGGGIGTRGPGETKLEVDRRTIRKRIEKLKNDLRQSRSHRARIKNNRKKSQTPAVALVGYTNAGKSTLINSLTGSQQVVEDRLFTTLDNITKVLRLDNGENITISDTVGFLHNLPHHLIEAFKATLEEVNDADILIHVLDISREGAEQRAKAVALVLKELGAQDKTIITALNKSDLAKGLPLDSFIARDNPNPVLISAKTKQNLGALLKEIEKHLEPRMFLWEGQLPYSRADLVDLFYKNGKVESVEYLQKGIKIKAFIPKFLYCKLNI